MSRRADPVNGSKNASTRSVSRRAPGGGAGANRSSIRPTPGDELPELCPAAADRIRMARELLCPSPRRPMPHQPAGWLASASNVFRRSSVMARIRPDGIFAAQVRATFG